MKNLRGALFVLLVVFTAGTERNSFVLSAPQEDPDVVIPDEGEVPDVIIDDDPCAEEPDGEQIDDVDGVVVWGDPADLRITEIMYHPPEPPPGTPFDRDAFEYIELLNIGELPLDVCGFGLSSANGMRFVFPSGMVVEPGERALVVKNLEAFTSAYETCEGEFVLAGEFAAGSFGDDGDLIVLADRLETLVAFEFSDQWLPSTDGAGDVLELYDERTPQQYYENIGAWIENLPTPGCEGHLPDVGESFQLPGDSNQDASLDISDVVVLWGHLFGGTMRPLPCEGPRINYGGNLRLLDVNGDYSVNMSDVMYLINALFGKGYPPVLGLQCIEITGCPDILECPGERD